jgi:ATP-binding cassette subfamily B protein
MAANAYDRQAGSMILRLIAFAAAHTAAYVLFVLSWVVIGGAAFSGGVDASDFFTWAALLVGAVPCNLLATRLQSTIALSLGGSLRRRLLRGTLGLDPDEMRGRGVGRMLGRVLDVEAVETLAVGGGLLGLVACVELVIAGVALAAGSVVTLAILAVWVAVTVTLAWRYLRTRGRWTDARLDLTDDLVAKMLGHRTRLAQQPPADWHTGEDHSLAGYEKLSRAMDRRLAVLLAVCPRGWIVAGALGLWASSADLAVGVGGVLLAAGALRSLTSGLATIADTTTAWANLKPLLAKHRTEIPTVTPAPASPLLSAENLSFRYPGNSVLDRVSLRIRTGDRVLLDGVSGSGKSTLVSLLAGLRRPQDGTLLLHGRSLADIGEQQWRRQIVLAPQFHENHLILGSLAFNLLLGRGWPAGPSDLDDARAVCRRLGLGPLLDRMPAGLQQIVGETGWQLSHGERSLVFLARTLLQGSDLIILDETFGALDPLTRHQALIVAAEAAPALIVVDH